MKKRVYLGGAMTHLTKDQYSYWRSYVQKMIECGAVNAECFNPANHFDFEDVTNGYITDKQAMDIDLYNLRRSDVLLANFSLFAKSLGTMAELAIAFDRNIPIIGVNASEEELHPWIEAMCTKIFNNLDDAVEYIVNHYLDVY